MNDERFTEEKYEQALIELFQSLGYDYEYGPDMERDYREPVDKEELQNCLQRVNATTLGMRMPEEVYEQVISEAVRLVTSIKEGLLEQRNEAFMDYLQNGVEVPYQQEGKQN